MNERTFIAIGTPVAKARARLSKWGSYTPKKTVDYENHVKSEYTKRYGVDMPLFGSISACMTFFMPIPKSESKTIKNAMKENVVAHTRKPDLDNMIKSITDALNGVAYNDDSQIIKIVAEKRYSEEPRVEVKLIAE